jgi:excisionase family DNA binding protein
MEPRHTPDSPELLTIGEAARALGVHVDTIRRWADAGRVQAIVLPSGHRRFYAGDIAALLDQGKAAS